MGRPVDTENRRERQDRFLAAYAETGILVRAAERSGVVAPQHHKWVRDDPEYAERFTAAQLEAVVAGTAKVNRRRRARAATYDTSRRRAGWAELQDRFLTALAETGVLADAYTTVGIAGVTYHNWRRSDPEFAQRADAALEAARERREEIVSARRSAASKKKWADPDLRERQAETQRDLWTPEMRAVAGERARRNAEDPAWRDAIGEAARENWADPEVRARRIAGMKAKWDDPEHQAKMREVSGRPELKTRRSEAAKAQWAAMDPAQRRERLKNARKAVKGGFQITKIEHAVM